MRGNAIKRIFVVLIIIAPVFSYSGCKKQARCGCGKDVIKSFAGTSCTITWTEGGGTIYAQTVGDAYSTYISVSYTHLRAHETVLDLVCRLLLEKKKKK